VLSAAFRRNVLPAKAAVGRNSVKADTVIKPPKITWAESFLYAGVSALLLLIASAFTQWWFLTLFALTPFLYRISRAGLKESMRLGLLLGFSLLAVNLTDNLLMDPIPALAKLLSGAALFTLFGLVLCSARIAFGFNPVITGVVWVGFELAVMQLGFGGGLLGEARFSSPYLNGIAVLFGFVIVSFVIVLFNSLLIMAVEKAVSLAEAREIASCEGGRIWDLYFAPGPHAQRFYLVPDVRGPPAINI
jgi:apolipoprotein N-acyltransferase